MTHFTVNNSQELLSQAPAECPYILIIEVEKCFSTVELQIFVSGCHVL